MPRKIIATIAALILCGAMLPELEVRWLPGPVGLPPALAGHLKVPSLAGAKASERAEASETCRAMGADHKIEFITYDHPGGEWMRAYFKGKERNPFGLFDTREEMVYYDADRDGHFDGKAKPGAEPVGENWCDLLENILQGRVKSVRP